MRKAALVLVMVFLASPNLAFAKSKLKKQVNRSFDRSAVKLVRLDFSGKVPTLHWKTPSQKTISYKVKNPNPGLIVKLKRYLKQALRLI